MKLFKLKGGSKATRKALEDFLEKINFEENLMKIIMEAIFYDIPFERTKAYKKFYKEIKGDKH